MAEFPASLLRLFEPTELSLEGKYRVRLWSWAQRRWVCMTLDDRLASRPGDLAPCFCKLSKVRALLLLYTCGNAFCKRVCSKLVTYVYK